MSFDLGLTGGDGGQYIRYNASTGTWQVDGEMVQMGQFVVDHNSLFWVRNLPLRIGNQASRGAVGNPNRPPENGTGLVGLGQQKLV